MATSLTQYISFSGASGCYGNLPLSAFSGANIFSIAAEISTTSTVNNDAYFKWEVIVGAKTATGAFALCVNNGNFCFYSTVKIGSQFTITLIKTKTIINDGLPHKVAVVSNADGSLDLYCDEERIHKADVNAVVPTLSTVNLAFNPDTNSFLQFGLHELSFWNIARQNIFSKITGNESGLLAWYLPSNDGLNDYSGNNRNAVLFGNPQFVSSNTLAVSLLLDVERQRLNSVTVQLDIERLLGRVGKA